MAQYLANRLEKHMEDGELNEETLTADLPSYLMEAIEYVTCRLELDAATVQGGAGGDG